MLRAYISYSWDDQAHVDRVVERLGRAKTHHDKSCFKAGEDFRQSINTNLTQSDLFVLFASSKSLVSTWVKYEISEAEWQIIHGRIRGFLVIIIDAKVQIAQLPKWMGKALAKYSVSPAQSTRLIESALVELTLPEQRLLYLGREDDKKRFVEQLLPGEPEDEKRIIVISGLEGSGRGTFLKHTIHDCLSLNTGPIIRLELSDTLEVLYLKLLEETEGLFLRAELAKSIEIFHEMSPEDRGHEIARLIIVLSKENTVPVIYDRGAMLNHSGQYKSEWLPVFESLKQFGSPYLALIHTRRPNIDNLLEKSPKTLVFTLKQIELPWTKVILGQIFKQIGIKASADDINQLAQYVDGYPPVIKWAVNRVVTYGLPIVLSNQRALLDFKSKAFIGLLRDLNLKKNEWATLRFLAAFSALPIEVIDVLVKTEREETIDTLTNLIDLSLVYPHENYYEIAAPIRYSVTELWGPITKEEYKISGNALREEFWPDEEKIPPLVVVDATIQALTFSGMAESERYMDITITSRLVGMAKKLYDSHNRFDPEARKLAIELTKRALKIDPSLNFAREILFKSYVREEKWTDAEGELKTIEGKGVREAFYLRGFYHWKRAEYSYAIKAFKSGRTAGDKSVRLIRDYAGCLFYVGRIGDAKELIKEAPTNAFRNPFVIDLAAQIAIELKDYPEALLRLNQLEEFASEKDVHHRRATLLFRQNQLLPALSEANLACMDSSAPFEFFGQRAKILVALRKENARTEVEKLRPQNVGQRDVCRGLRCELALIDEDWKAAELIWSEIQQKSLPVNQSLLKKILSLKREDTLLSPAERRKTEDELSRFAVTPDMFAMREDVETDAADDEPGINGDSVTAT